MATSPKLPADESPLTDAQIERIFANAGEEMVLIGGQALHFWMRRFGISARGLSVSNDADFLGNVQQAGALADRLGAHFQKPPASALTALVAQVRLPLRNGLFGNIDVLHQLYTTSTPKKTVEFTQRVKRNAMTVKWSEDAYIRVMDPFDLLESRIQNAVGFANEQMKGAHVITQAHWAIEVAKAALFLLASGDDEFTSRVGHKIQQIVRLARSSPGRRAWSELGLDVLEAIDADLIQAMAPTSAVQLTHVRVMQQQRAKGAARRN
jgi:hypothetical protein